MFLSCNCWPSLAKICRSVIFQPMRVNWGLIGSGCAARPRMCCRSHCCLLLLLLLVPTPQHSKKYFPTASYFPRISRFIQKSEKSPKKIHQIFHEPIHFPRPPLAPAAQAHYACIQPPLISHNLLHTTSDICWPRLMRPNTNIFFSWSM